MITLAGDIGGTAVKLGLVEDDHVLARGRLAVADRLELAPLLDQMIGLWQEMLAGCGRQMSQVNRVGLAFAGVVDPHGRQIVDTNGKFDDAAQIDLVDWASRSMGLPLAIDNDARAALLGEWHAGAGQGTRDLVMMTLGTGIGAACLIDRQIIRGSHGMAGVVGGHLTLDWQGRPCTCGNIGCAEALASTDRLGEVVAEVAQRNGLQGPLLQAARPGYQQVFQQAAGGDRLAIAVRDWSVRVWSGCVVNLIHAYGPQRVVVGGGIAAGSSEILAHMQRYVDKHAWMPWGRVQVVPAALGDDAALVGCAYYPLPGPGTSR